MGFGLVGLDEIEDALVGLHRLDVGGAYGIEVEVLGEGLGAERHQGECSGKELKVIGFHTYSLVFNHPFR